MALGLFRDRIVPSSELNRRSGQVLREAYVRPVTVTRPHGDLVIMNRSLAASMAGAADVLPQLTRSFVALLRLPEDDRAGRALLSTLTDEECTDLAFELVAAAAASVDRMAQHDALQAVVHEWIETKRWISNPQAMAAVQREEEEASDTGGIPVKPAADPFHPEEMD